MSLLSFGVKVTKPSTPQMTRMRGQHGCTVGSWPPLPKVYPGQEASKRAISPSQANRSFIMRPRRTTMAGGQSGNPMGPRRTSPKSMRPMRMAMHTFGKFPNPPPPGWLTTLTGLSFLLGAPDGARVRAGIIEFLS